MLIWFGGEGELGRGLIGCFISFYLLQSSTLQNFSEVIVMSPEHSRWLAMAMKRQRVDLQFLGSDGRRVDGHQSLVCLASPMLAQVLFLCILSIF